MWCSTRRRLAGIPARQVFFIGNNVGDDADRATIVGQALAKNDRGAVFDDGSLNRAVHEQAATTFPIGGVGFLDMAAIKVDAILAGQTGMPAGQVNQVGDHLGDGIHAVRAGDADQRHTAAFALGEQVVDDSLANRTRFADARLDVHEQAGAGVHFDDGATLLS